ncbi:hypothetical protein J2S43_000087 [Catenuloplanes nepalensis]|uniref:Uncharacterized protein n=1 Tax=Catenuloplanes nepalensis TaxID=587533 RepID=A0ABT9MJI0_9ACTN|nr:hypothetical protein [Catenuloplanes nepalensis]MDP9791575.1 hypothetical protein [Catenuloplanes nepalensis]
MSTVHLGLSLGHATDSDAEHWLAGHLPAALAVPGLVACTHNVPSPHPHVALSFEAPEGAILPEMDPALRAAADEAAARHRTRVSGRAVLFPGADALTGTLTAADILDLSAIERITILGGTDATRDTTIETRDFVRPLFRSGRLELVLVPIVGGRFAPFEVPNPTPCCADH